jgi:hypothetical protein
MNAAFWGGGRKEIVCTHDRSRQMDGAIYG